MGDVIFTGETEGITQRQMDFISEVIQKRGFNPKEVEVENVGKVGDNYMGNVKRVIIHEDGKTFKMIVKIAPEAEMMREMMQVAMIYRNEMTIYRELLPRYRDIQRSAGVKDLYRSAECYGYLDEDVYETIILEDLNESQYQMLDRFKPLSHEAVKVYLKSIAVFHSLSFVLRHEDPETFERIKSKLVDITDSPMMETEQGMMYFKGLEDFALSVLDDEKHKLYVRGLNTNQLNLKREVDAGERGSKYTVIQQGDSWTNNIMYKLEDGVPVECVLIDYQMTLERSPVYDIMYMLFNSTSYEQRQQHYFEYLDYYHSQLDLSLRNYGLKAGDVYPREQLDKDLKRYGKFMLSMNLMVTSTILKQTNEAQKMKDMMEAKEIELSEVEEMLQVGDETRLLMKSRIEGIIDSFVEYGYVEKIL